MTLTDLFFCALANRPRGKMNTKSTFTVRKAIHSLEWYKGFGSLQTNCHFSQADAHPHKYLNAHTHIHLKAMCGLLLETFPTALPALSC